MPQIMHKIKNKILNRNVTPEQLYMMRMKRILIEVHHLGKFSETGEHHNKHQLIETWNDLVQLIDEGKNTK